MGNVGTPAHRVNGRAVWQLEDINMAQDLLAIIQRIHPAARILRLVRRERHTAEERAVVDAALAWEASGREISGATWGLAFAANETLEQACAALRAKRGG
jgi:hypothetical protein